MSKRVSFDLPGLEHTNPIPSACRVGPVLMTSGISGADPRSGKFPQGIEAQCAQMFANIRTILEVGGATPEDVVKLTVWLKDRSQRPQVNKEWLTMFPDPHSRPARHTFSNPELGGDMLVQCEVMAVITDGK
jgi:enamine deaminase RidA (YjgF/YER057c/UK114 family)